MIRKILVFYFFLPFYLFSNTLEDIRKQFPNAVSNSEVCESLIADLLNRRDASAIERAYLGTLQTIWANHTRSPISKWKTFQKGKDNLEAAVAQAPNSVEIRMLRYSVQLNCPRFLNYYQDLERDRSYILENKEQITHPQVQKLYQGLLMNKQSS